MNLRSIAIGSAGVAGMVGALAVSPVTALIAGADDSDYAALAQSALAGPNTDRDAATAAPESGTSTPAPDATTTEPAPAATPQVESATYTGTAYDTPWGPVQVQATIGGGQILDITWLSYPMDRRSQRINSSAAPMLVEQALSAQSANVDGVSGATYTSEGFIVSLQSAMDQAGI